jgi:hypothetical protein
MSFFEMNATCAKQLFTQVAGCAAADDETPSLIAIAGNV